MDVSDPSGLANHAESVASYLYDYGRTRDNALRKTFSKSFFQYLLGACWMKMHSRFRSWHGLGFIKVLERAITDNTIVSQVKEIGSDYGPLKLPDELGPGDRTLADFFSHNKDGILEMMQYSYSKLPMESEIRRHLSKHLNLPLSSSDLKEGMIVGAFKAFGEAVKLTLNQGKALYTNETAFSFHVLLYFSFLICGRELSEIRDSYQLLKSATSVASKKTDKEKTAAVESYKESILAAEFPVRVLICVLSSTAFKHHIRVWSSEGRNLNSILPCFANKADYLFFGKERLILGSLKLGPLSPSPNCEVFEDDITEVC
jgi:hypothetical protein